MCTKHSRLLIVCLGLTLSGCVFSSSKATVLGPYATDLDVRGGSLVVEYCKVAFETTDEFRPMELLLGDEENAQTTTRQAIAGDCSSWDVDVVE